MVKTFDICVSDANFHIYIIFLRVNVHFSRPINSFIFSIDTSIWIIPIWTTKKSYFLTVFMQIILMPRTHLARIKRTRYYITKSCSYISFGWNVQKKIIIAYTRKFSRLKMVFLFRKEKMCNTLKLLHIVYMYNMYILFVEYSYQTYTVHIYTYVYIWNGSSTHHIYLNSEKPSKYGNLKGLYMIAIHFLMLYNVHWRLCTYICCTVALYIHKVFKVENFSKV